MKQKSERHSLRTPAFKKVKGKCVIPGAMPTEALADYILKDGDEGAKDIRDYVELETHGETVKHLEKVSSENIFGQQMDAWDVRTNRNRWWVITNPTNLYSQKLFPSLDYTISFYVGVRTRVAQSEMTEEQKHDHDRVNQLWNRLARARTTLFSAKKPEDFQSVGMKCRECLLLLSQTLGQMGTVPEGKEAPQRGNFIDWCELIAEYGAAGGSNERLRSYLKAVSKSTWQLVNWLTHAQNADKFDGSIAIEATENVMGSFMSAAAKNETSKRKVQRKSLSKKGHNVHDRKEEVLFNCGSTSHALDENRTVPFSL